MLVGNTANLLTIASGATVNVSPGLTLNNVNNVGGVALSNGVLTNNSGLTLVGGFSSGSILTQGAGTLTLVPSNLLITSSSANIVSPVVVDVTNLVQNNPGTVAPADTSVAPEVTAFTAPEPSSALSLAFGAAILLGGRRRRRV